LLVRENKEAIASHVFDLSGNLRLALRMTPEGGAEILRIDGVFLQRIWACSEKERVHCFGFHKDGRQCYLSTNAGSDVDLERLVLLDVETGEVEEVESDPEQEVDFNAPIFSRKTEELIGTSYVGDRLRTYFTDEEWDRDYQILKTKWPWQEIVIPSMTDDDSLCIVGVSSDVDPATVYLFDRKTKKIEFLYKARPLLPIDHLASMTPVVYTARDGLTIHGYLTIPRGVEPRNLPLVAFPHGGPWSRDTWGYNAYAQLLANRGYAVLQMNFRGSTGYGKKFLNAGNKEWGDAMQNDITDGVLHLISKQIADPKKVAIFGASYGGYASLAGLAFTPDVYAAGISFVGPSNLLTLLRTLPPYWSSVKAHTYNAVGDPMIPEDLERLRRQSPLFSAANITAPLLVIQGANDPRVKKAESDQIVASLHQLGREVEYIVAPDEGHGFARAENRIAAAVAIEKFLAKHLGGRFQESISSAVSERLRELTVDVDSVVMPVAVQEGY
jgi:dipeptidyl aminopeptidase/acylaminoacyl peptidase